MFRVALFEVNSDLLDKSMLPLGRHIRDINLPGQPRVGEVVHFSEDLRQQMYWRVVEVIYFGVEHRELYAEYTSLHVYVKRIPLDS